MILKSNCGALPRTPYGICRGGKISIFPGRMIYYNCISCSVVIIVFSLVYSPAGESCAGVIRADLTEPAVFIEPGSALCLLPGQAAGLYISANPDDSCERILEPTGFSGPDGFTISSFELENSSTDVITSTLQTFFSMFLPYKWLI